MIKKEDRAKPWVSYSYYTDYAENNRIEPDVCYEVCHELELVMIEKCKAKGMDAFELKKHKQAAEANFRASKESLKHR